jgi:hypothetical protein
LDKYAALKQLWNPWTALKGQLHHKRIDANIDNMAVLKSWEKKGSKDRAINNFLKGIFEVSPSLNCELKLKYIRSADNNANAPSQNVSLLDCKLSPQVWPQEIKSVDTIW